MYRPRRLQAGHWPACKTATSCAWTRAQDGDVLRLDAGAGTLDVLVEPAQWQARVPATMPAALKAANGVGLGRELFAGLRRNALAAEQGACAWL